MAKLTEAERNEIFEELNKQDPEFIAKVMPVLESLYKYYFRCEIEGFENVPEEKALFVGNHNGLLTFEVVMLFYAWWKRFGGTRRALGLAHGVAISHPLFKWLIPRLGAIPADPTVADEAMGRGYSLLVYPGGEKESFRAYKDRKIVDFYGRKGFVRLALRNKVPIVPIVSAGAHETYVIFHRGEEMAKKLGLYDKYRVHGLPLTLRSAFFVWCMATGLFTFFPLLLAPAAFMSIFVPMPAKMHFKIMAPIDVCSMVDPKLSEEENLTRIYHHVINQMQKVHYDMYARRRYPVFG